MTAKLSDGLFGFLKDHIDSIYQLELLLFLHSAKDRPWSDDEIARALYLPPQTVRTALSDLVNSGVIQSGEDATYRFAPAGAIREQVGELAAAYTDYRVRIVEFIYSKKESDRG